jgi:hypothetical protein
MAGKIHGAKYATMLAGMRAVVEYYGGPAEILATYADGNVTRMLWSLWNRVDENLRYDDSHPAFQSGHWQRILPPNPSFDMYSDGDNDTHILTALKRIGRELGIA